MKVFQLISRVKWQWGGLAVVVFAQTCLSQVYTFDSQDQVYLSNLSYLDTSGSPSSVIPFGRDINDVVPRIAQEFQTGMNPGGYLLTTVTLAFHNALGGPVGFSLNLFSTASSGLPSNSLGLLAGNPNPNQIGNYTYSASGIILKPNQEYFLVMQGNGVGYGNNQYEWYRANTTIADSNDGWEIGGIWYSINGGAWTYWGGYPPGALQIEALPVPEPSTIALLFMVCTLITIRHIRPDPQSKSYPVRFYRVRFP